MPINFVVLTVVQQPQKLRPCGLIGDRRFTPKIIVASGKSFTSVESVKQPGGLGVAIAPPQSGAVGSQKTSHQRTNLHHGNSCVR